MRNIIKDAYDSAAAVAMKNIINDSILANADEIIENAIDDLKNDIDTMIEEKIDDTIKQITDTILKNDENLITDLIMKKYKGKN
jgi:hypothetical protein